MINKFMLAIVSIAVVVMAYAIFDLSKAIKIEKSNTIQCNEIIKFK